MGFRSVRVSDISGIELNESEAVNVVIRDHPKSEPRQFDASQEELKALKTVGNLVSLEYRFADGTSQDVFVTATEFAKLVPDDKLSGFDAVRGRRKGFRPGVAE
jgi:hypothetical protein